MLKTVRLRDGSDVEVGLFDLEELQDQLDDVTVRSNKSNFDGFSYFNPNTILNLNSENLYRGPEFDTVDDERKYHKFVAVRDELDLLAGIGVLKWRNPDPMSPFPRYCMNLVETRTDMRAKGVATSIYKKIDESDFLKGEIFQTGVRTNAFNKFLRPKVCDLLNAEEYVLIPEDYELDAPPKEPGKYNKFGDKV